jgi:hypothetical protein
MEETKAKGSWWSIKQSQRTPPKATSASSSLPPPPPPPKNATGIYPGVNKAPSCQPPLTNPLPASAIYRIEKQALQRAKVLANKQKDQQKRDEHNISGKDLWLLKIIPNFEKYENSKLVKKLCTKGIPSAARPKAWPLLMGNKLQITPELMEIFHNHALDFESEDNKRRRAKEAKFRLNSGRTADGTAKNNDVDDVSNNTASSQQEDVPDSPRLGKRKSLHHISVDLPRTFPHLSFFSQGPMHDDLKKLLMSYAFYRPDVGYIQGMSYIAAVLLLYMDVNSAFSCFANLLSTHFYFDFFRLDPAKINGHLSVYDALFKESLPKLFVHFQREEVLSEMYMIDWLLTLYSRSMPIDIAARVWDLYLCEGEMSLFRVAIGILKMHRDMLLRLDMGGILQFLHNIPDDMNEHVLFDAFVAKVDFSKHHFDKIHKKIHAAAAAAAIAKLK